MAFSLTEEQQAAVDNRGGGLLVSAAAGSGKTRVLVERLLARVEEGADVDRFLVITYTKAAAAELRGRIVEEISDRMALRPADSHLRRQATLVYKAGISTVHAFCAQLLRECGHLLDIDPDFRLCDEGEAGILMLRALNDVLDKRYEDIQPDSDFARLVDTMSAGRDDQRLVQIVLDIRGRVQAHPDPAAWLAGQERTFALEGVTDPVQTPWGKLLLTDAAGQAAYWRRRMEEARDLCERDANLLANYGDSVAETARALGEFEKAAGRGWDQARDLLPIPFPTVGRKKMVDDPAAVERVNGEPVDFHARFAGGERCGSVIEAADRYYTERENRRDFADRKRRLESALHARLGPPAIERFKKAFESWGEIAEHVRGKSRHSSGSDLLFSADVDHGLCRCFDQRHKVRELGGHRRHAQPQSQHDRSDGG